MLNKAKIEYLRKMQGWEDFNKEVEFLPFEEAREFVRSLKLNNEKQWREYLKSGNKPKKIPSNPSATYKDKGWISLGDWFGTGTIATQNRVYRPFGEAREFARSLKLSDNLKWSNYCKSGNRPNDIPSYPDGTYKDKGWISWGDWLGTGSIYKKNVLAFEEAREFARSLKLKSQTEWFKYCKSNKHSDVPVAPQQAYKEDWISWGDWLGTGRIADNNKTYRSFEKAIKFVHSLNLKSKKEWLQYCKSKPDDIPTCPNQTYKDKGWNGWGDWLGTGTIANFNKVYRPFEDARKFVHSLNLKSQKEWLQYCKSGNKPSDTPSNPNATYKDKGWIGYGDWLGRKNA